MTNIVLRPAISHFKLAISNLKLSNVRLEMADINPELVNFKLESANFSLKLADSNLELGDLNLELGDLNLKLAVSQFKLVNSQCINVMIHRIITLIHSTFASSRLKPNASQCIIDPIRCEAFSRKVKAPNRKMPSANSPLKPDPSGSFPGKFLYNSPSAASSSRDFLSGRMCGNTMTSRIECLFVKSITSRSMPMPIPAAGGMP